MTQLKWYLFTAVCFVILSVQIIFAQNNSDDTESFVVSMDFEKIGRENFTALLEENSSTLYLPVEDIFKFLKMNIQLNDNEQIISGYLDGDKKPFTLDYKQNKLTYNNTTITLTSSEIKSDMGVIYLSKQVFENALGFSIKFDFRSLSAVFKSDFELPLAKMIRQNTARDNLRKLSNDIKYDTIFPRQYHWFRFGMLDWSFTGRQIQKNQGETRLGLALGAELLGGETDVWLNYSDKYGLNRNQQRYQWKWVDNSLKMVKQVQLGRVYSKNVASILYPIDGFMITNTPTTIRKSIGEYLISENTHPDWIVELYINKVLMDYTRADASGNFTFKVPLVYGTSNVVLRFYGPNGEESSEEKVIYMPYNFLPKNELEYKVTGGTLLDSVYSKFTHGEVNYGVNRWLTVGAGVEYLSSIKNNSPYIAFINASVQPFPKMILTAEYAYNIRTKATLNYTFPFNGVMELNYSNYTKGQTAIIYNYLEERIANFSLPFRMKKFSGYAKLGYRENIYSNFSYSTCEASLAGNYQNFNSNLGNFLNWTNSGGMNFYSSLSLGWRINAGFNARFNTQYSYSQRQFVSLKAEVEKQIMHKGYVSVGYENNYLTNYQSVNVSVRFDFDFMSTYLSSYFSNKQSQFSESARGSMAFGSGNHYVHFDKQNAVGRSGISVVPYVDINHNEIFDEGEPLADKLNVKCNGGQIILAEKDQIIRIVGLEPFVDYNISFDENGFDNLSWRILNKSIKVTTDPNQFKKIELAVQPMGEITGVCVNDDNSPMARILIHITNSAGEVVKSVVSESDGYFSYLGLKPGKYTVSVDSVQQKRINYSTDPLPFEIKPDENGDIVDVGNFVLHGNKDTDADNVPDENDKCPETPQNTKVDEKGCPVEIIVSDITKTDNTLDSLFSMTVLFHFSETVVRNEYLNDLKQFADSLKNNKSLIVEIQGHADSIGSADCNYKLSVLRAKDVAKTLYSFGVNKAQIKIKCYGETQPIESNKTFQGRAKNRRVVFRNLSPIGIEMNDSYQNITSKVLADNYIEFNLNYSLANYQLMVKNVRSIFFKQAQYTVSKENTVLPDAIVMLLKKNKYIQIAPGGFADTDGELNNNFNQGSNRINSVAQYTEVNDVDAARIIKQNPGEPKPVNKNSNIYEKSVNRRVFVDFINRNENVNTDKEVFALPENMLISNINQLFIVKVKNEFMIQVGAAYC